MTSTRPSGGPALSDRCTRGPGSEGRCRPANPCAGVIRADAGWHTALRLPKKAQALLSFLAVNRGQPAAKDTAATLLCGNSGTEQARQSLRQCLVALRAALGPQAEGLVADVATISLLPSPAIGVDAAALLASAGRYEEAADAAQRTLRVQPDYPPGLRLSAVTCGLLGRIDEGRAYTARLLAKQPKSSVSWMRAFLQVPLQRNMKALESYLKGARLAGVPEES